MGLAQAHPYKIPSKFGQAMAGAAPAALILAVSYTNKFLRFHLTLVAVGNGCEEGYTLDTDGQNCTGKNNNTCVISSAPISIDTSVL